jgi:hypothetical protein
MAMAVKQTALAYWYLPFLDGSQRPSPVLENDTISKLGTVYHLKLLFVRAHIRQRDLGWNRADKSNTKVVSTYPRHT